MDELAEYSLKPFFLLNPAGHISPSSLPTNKAFIDYLT